jgi:hypothetical protein
MIPRRRTPTDREKRDSTAEPVRYPNHRRHMSIRRLRTLGVLAATSAIAVAALGAPAGASATIGAGKVDVAVDTPLSAPTKPREVRDVNAVVTAVGIGRFINQVKVDLADTNADLKGPCNPRPSVKFYDTAGKQYAGDNWLQFGAATCLKLYTPRVGLPVLAGSAGGSFGIDQTVAPSAYPQNLLPILAKPGKVCAVINTAQATDSATGKVVWHESRPVCAPIL